MRTSTSSVLLLAAVAAIAGAGCVSESSEEYLLSLKADATRGGALWDKWWKVPGVKTPRAPGTAEPDGGAPAVAADNPLYVARSGNPRRGPDTWRCKECHGWDYRGAEGAYAQGSHRTGFRGVLGARGKDATRLHRVLRDGAELGEGHAFGKVLSDRDLADLVKFLREGVADPTAWIDSGGRSRGDAERGKERFAEGCAGCHGSDGKKLNFAKGEYASEFVSDVASTNPGEFFHKVRFGQPGTSMPTGVARAYYQSDVADLLAFAQGLSVPGLEGASAARGGALWDTWWKVNGAEKPSGTNPLYADPAYNTRGARQTGAGTWRCKECHGWDYKGRDGAYAAGSHATGIAGVHGAQGKSVAELTAAIADGVFASGAAHPGHRFLQEGLLGAGDIKDLVLFVREGLVDDDLYVSKGTGLAKASAATGQGLYAASCASCHGGDGRRANFAHGDPAPAVEYVADVARENPYELLHKIRFGQPGSDEESEEMFEELGLRFGHMPNRLDLGLTEDQIAAVAAHAQKLPGSVERGGLLWDTWWKVPYVRSAGEPGTASSPLPADNPYYVAFAANARRGSQTWRCKECHGWDMKGALGAYGSGSHRTGFPGVLAAARKGAGVLYRAIADGEFTNADGTLVRIERSHQFGSQIGDAAARDLVNFVLAAYDYDAEVVGTAQSRTAVKATYDRATMRLRTRDASLTLGQVKFEGTCAACHGADGRAINFQEREGGVEYLGALARGNPWEVLHKMRSGQPGTAMPAAVSSGWGVDDLADVLLFAQQLP